MIRFALIVFVALSAAACARPPATAPAETSVEPVSDQDKTLYALGIAIADSLEQYNLSETELEMVQAGLADRLGGGETAVDLGDYHAKISALARDRAATVAQKEKDASAAFVEQMAAQPGAQKFDSGLVVIEMQPGDGPSPKAEDTVQVHYHGMLRDGTVFDSSVERGSPATFPLTRVISCWTEGVQKIKVGGKAKLVCPSDIAYGDRGSPPRIPPGAALVFEVELLEIQ
ncbi:MAG: FKBP-type peptidyl-prolyl cis-trans isomerase [Gammaproteobacteria bacterium]|nr:FKBP-type peptidyl-prolyl cis-trans isomerase [Gammaproteobacteria bacterium]NNF62109.1 FKBP-type peptidyl-prolyl cis-trans isomerase [Gammaproteobacteria bacterium]NNM20493.1 FKBP-type peptidyl-prolyl cis-trans isomerase [Gammaproteobacteria bacterium]